MSQPRIVSLIASATEIVCALGFEDCMVGRSHECDFPLSVEKLPVCSSSKVNVDGSSRAIDDQVRAIVADALSVYRVDAKLLDELAPTVIVTQTQCEVCAVSLKDVEQAVCELVASEPRIVSLEPMALGDVFDDIRTVAGTLGRRERAERLNAGLTARLDAIRERSSGLGERPTIACIEWIDPLMNAENWVPELVEIAGGKVILGEAGKHSGYFEFERVIEADPDVIAVMPCGFDIPRTAVEMPPLAARPGWSDLSAVRSGRVFLTDGNQYFNRPGPRVVESAEILAELLHPEVFDFGHRGSGWTEWVGL
ncbi:MAG: cobalamin-binding protein [Acidobacteria bacterium]|nr:cobalamin-binding protein [Acidobacteriota bacterium]MCY3931181.1 cobalamin-binding protein [Acidobacteriota bacterium]